MVALNGTDLSRPFHFFVIGLSILSRLLLNGTTCGQYPQSKLVFKKIIFAGLKQFAVEREVSPYRSDFALRKEFISPQHVTRLIGTCTEILE